MEIVHRLGGITFVWDSRKASSNLQKHAVSFEAASEIFLDPFIRVLRSDSIGGEERDMAIGMTAAWKVLVVVHRLLDDSVRIISARPATIQERASYEDDPAS